MWMLTYGNIADWQAFLFFIKTGEL